MHRFAEPRIPSGRPLHSVTRHVRDAAVRAALLNETEAASPKPPTRSENGSHRNAVTAIHQSLAPRRPDQRDMMKILS